MYLPVELVDDIILAVPTVSTIFDNKIILSNWARKKAISKINDLIIKKYTVKSAAPFVIMNFCQATTVIVGLGADNLVFIPRGSHYHFPSTNIYNRNENGQWFIRNDAEQIQRKSNKLCCNQCWVCQTRQSFCTII